MWKMRRPAPLWARETPAFEARSLQFEQIH
jgi:hypothetical protein